jgi:hypothetical protein
MKVKVGDVWLDRDGHHNLVLEVGELNWLGVHNIAILTLETGTQWTQNRSASFGETCYFYRIVA